MLSKVVIISMHPNSILYAKCLKYELRNQFQDIEVSTGVEKYMKSTLYIGFLTTSFKIPPRHIKYIHYNAEPLNQDRWKNSEEYWNILQNAWIIWNYCDSITNILKLDNRTKNKKIYTVPFYCPSLLSQQLPKILDNHRSKDVLFLGSINERRKRILRFLCHNGVNVTVGGRIWGDAYTDLIRQYKIVIAISFYDNRSDDDMYRISYLVGNGCLVFAERTCTCRDFENVYNCCITANVSIWPTLIRYLLLRPEIYRDLQKLYCKRWGEFKWSFPDLNQ